MSCWELVFKLLNNFYVNLIDTTCSIIVGRWSTSSSSSSSAVVPAPAPAPLSEIKQRYGLRELSEQEIEAIQNTRRTIPSEFPTDRASSTTGYSSSRCSSDRSRGSVCTSGSGSSSSSSRPSSSTTNSSSSDYYPSPNGPTVPVPRY